MKKRILSLILALSMVLSVLPLGAFAEGSNQGLTIGSDGYPVGTSGTGWSYDNNTKTLTLTEGTFDFSSTVPVQCAIDSIQTIIGGTFNGKVRNIGTISGGTFNETVTNASTGTISDGTFNGDVTNYGTIKDNGTFEGTVTNKINGLIYGGTFQNKCSVTNDGTITGNGIFAGIVTNNRFISGGTFQSTSNVTNANDGTISDGTFNGEVQNSAQGTISGGTFSSTSEVYNYNSGTIEKGTFEGTVTNYGNINSNGTFNGKVSNRQGGSITNGTFNYTVENVGGGISNGTFTHKVENNDHGTIFGGTFAGGVNNSNDSLIFGGVFNGYINVPGVGVYPIAVDEAYPGAKIEKVNDVSAVWEPYVVVIDEDALPEVTVTASTKIYSLNGKSLSTNPYSSSQDNSDKTTVKFTMPKEGVTIGCGGLIMEGGFPVGSNNGNADCEGKGWTYSKKDASNPTGKLTLTSNSGKYDFSYTYPQNTTSKGAGAEPVACAVETQSGVEITGGTFNAIVYNGQNSPGGIISNGTFNGTVTNHAGTISGGKFEGTVINSVSGKISGNGTFNATVTNDNNGEISNGTFKGDVTNYSSGTISGGTFAGSVDNKSGTVTGGVFNLKANPTNVTGYAIKWDDAYSQANPNAKIVAVNDVSAEWDPYVVVTELTKNQKVIITASTKIYSLNHKPLSTDNCNSAHDGNENTVKFTMPNANVVLNGAITSTDLVMENGYPKDSNGGKNPCKGDGWEYIKNDPTNGDMLLLTGSNQTGGLFDFSTIGDGSAVECNVFVGRPTAITGGEFNGKVFNNSGILGGTFHGEVDNRAPGIIKGGTFNGAVENNGIIEKGTFNGAVTGSGTVSESITGSGTLNGELITKTPEPKPEPEPTTYTVTVIGGTIDGKTSVSAKENDTLTVVLDQSDIPDGMTFDMWSISSSKLSGDINVDYRAEAMTFQMPAEDVTIRAQYRSAEIIEDAAPSPLATAATIAVGGAAAGIVVWQGVSLGVDLYLANALPQGVPVPTDRRALALLLWETAGKPEVALPTLYGDIPAEEIELQKATRWAVQNGLMDAADKKDASFFDPDHYVTKMDVFGAWLRLKKLLGTIGTSPTQ